MASILPAPLLPVAEGEVVAPVAEAALEVAEADDDVLEAAAGTSVAMRVPQVLQDWEPGLARRHWAKVSWQMWFGRVLRYWAMSGGLVPLAQLQVKSSVD